MGRQPRSIGEIAVCFAEMGLRGFGGVAAQARDVLVERRGWLSEREFAEVIGLGQILPGGNVMNMAAILGDRWGGARGAVVAVAALTVPSASIAIALFALASRVASEPHVASAERSVVAAAAGILIATGVRALRTSLDPARRMVTAARAGVALLACALALIPRFGLPLAACVATPLALWIEMRARR